jgi:hypothetical protein
MALAAGPLSSNMTDQECHLCRPAQHMTLDTVHTTNRDAVCLAAELELSEAKKPSVVHLKDRSEFCSIRHQNALIKFPPGGEVGDREWNLQYMHNCSVLLEYQRKRDAAITTKPPCGVLHIALVHPLPGTKVFKQQDGFFTQLDVYFGEQKHLLCSSKPSDLRTIEEAAMTSVRPRAVGLPKSEAILTCSFWVLPWLQFLRVDPANTSAIISTISSISTPSITSVTTTTCVDDLKEEKSDRKQLELRVRYELMYRREGNVVETLIGEQVVTLPIRSRQWIKLDMVESPDESVEQQQQQQAQRSHIHVYWDWFERDNVM